MTLATHARFAVFGFAWIRFLCQPLLALAADGPEQGSCKEGSTWTCGVGCYDEEDEACHAGLSEMDCAEIYGHVNWAPLCNCYCREVICQMGCYSTATDTCQGNVTQQQCEQDSGNGQPVEWAKECDCTASGPPPAGDGASSKATANLYFSVPAFVVLFRESLEVVIVLVIIIQFLTKIREDGSITDDMFYRFRREVYAGASLGFSVCLVFGVGFLVLASLVYGLFEGDSELIFEACMMMLTSLVLSFLALNFYRMIHTREGHERKFRQKIEETVAASVAAEKGEDTEFGKKHAFFVLAFTTGLREGLESIIFLTGVVSDVKDLSSLPLPIITALIFARLVGWCFFQGTKNMRVEWFMRVSAVILLFIAAGFFCSSMHNIQELDAFGTWSPKSKREWQNKAMFDATECCNDKTNRFFVLMRALLGWQDQPTPVELFAYLTYWVFAIIIGSFMVAHAKREMAKKLEAWRAMDAAAKNGDVAGSPDGKTEHHGAQTEENTSAPTSTTADSRGLEAPNQEQAQGSTEQRQAIV